MFRPVRILSISLAAALFLGATAAAQAPDIKAAGPSESGEQLGRQLITVITGTAISDRIIDPGTLNWKDNSRKVRNQISELTMEWSVPGLPDTIRALWNSDEYTIPGQARRAKIHSGTFLLLDGIGSMAGRFGGIEYVDGTTDLQVTLMGVSGYAGQCAILNIIRSPQRVWKIDGLVFDCMSLS